MHKTSFKTTVLATSLLCAGLWLAALSSCTAAQDIHPQTMPPRWHISVLAGVSPRTLLGNADRASNLGIRAGILLPQGLYVGGVVSVHPFTLASTSGEMSGGAPLVACGEVGYELALTPTMALRPYLGAGYYGLFNSYQGYGRARIQPEIPLVVGTAGAVYSLDLAPNIIAGAEARLVWQAGMYFNLHLGLRL